jgi:DNA-binding MarR family transcriptional regulator
MTTDNWEQISRFAVPEDSAGYLLWQVTHAWQRRVESTLTALDITHLQFVLLAGIGWLTKNGELITQVQLAEFCKIDVMQISQVASKLEIKGLIDRPMHPMDTRAKALTLTTRGESVFRQAIPLVEKLDQEFFGPGNSQVLIAELKRLQR